MTYVTPTDLNEKETLDNTDKLMVTDTEGLTQAIQAKKIFQVAAARGDVIICNTAFNAAPAATADIKAATYYEGLTVRVMFKFGHIGSSFTFNLNELGALPIYVIKDGTPVLMTNHALNRGTGTYNWYCQEYTTLELMYTIIGDQPAWMVVGNPVVLSKSSDTEGYTVYADGKGTDKGKIIFKNYIKGYVPITTSESSIYTFPKDINLIKTYGIINNTGEGGPLYLPIPAAVYIKYNYKNRTLSLVYPPSDYTSFHLYEVTILFTYKD